MSQFQLLSTAQSKFNILEPILHNSMIEATAAATLIAYVNTLNKITLDN